MYAKEGGVGEVYRKSVKMTKIYRIYILYRFIYNPYIGSVNNLEPIVVFYRFLIFCLVDFLQFTYAIIVFSFADFLLKKHFVHFMQSMNRFYAVDE